MDHPNTGTMLPTNIPSNMPQTAEHPLVAIRAQLDAIRTFLEDEQFDDAAAICRQGLEHLDAHSLSAEIEAQLRVEFLWLLLLARDGQPPERVALWDKVELERAAMQVVEAATRNGDPALKAKAESLRGKVILQTQGLAAAIPLLEHAYELAQNSQDAIIQFLILADLGFYSVGQNLRRGLELMLQGHTLYSEPAAQQARGPYDTLLDRIWYELKGRIGVVKFDDGTFQEALLWLEASYTYLRQSRQAPRSYISQLYMAMGQWEATEDVLRTSVEAALEKAMPDVPDLYNMSLLGKLYLEWGRIDDAAPLLERSWAIIQPLHVTWAMTLVGNYHTELLLQPTYAHYDIIAAERQARDVAAIARRDGWHRSIVTALGLRSQAALLGGDVDAAVRWSTEAADYLRQYGTLPAVRTEEIALIHYQALLAAGQERAALESLRQAADILYQKIDSITDVAYRQTMLEHVSISQAIVTACKQHGLEPRISQ